MTAPTEPTYVTRLNMSPDEKLVAYGPGPWLAEPDRVEFEHAGLPCLINRAPLGNWCGYAAVPPGHPLHGVGYDAAEDGVHQVSAHGGLTFASECHGEICHVPKPGEPDDVWWFGFDCAHSGDLTPKLVRELHGIHTPAGRETYARLFSGDVYRTVEYVIAETKQLAEQLRDAAAAPAPAPSER